MVRRILATAATAALSLAALSLAAALVPGAASAATAAPACSGVISIGQFAFSPPSVPAGQTSTLSLTAQNCTGQTVQGQIIWFGRYTWAGQGIPPGCPAIDPLAQPYTIAPQGSYTNDSQRGDTIPGCQATGLQVTAQFTVNGVSGTAAQATASLVITQQATGSCHVSYSPSNWPGGFTASVTVGNAGTAPVTGWTLAFTFPGDQQITSAWNASVSQDGASVSAANLGYNATIAPGGSQSFGFQGTWASSDLSPTAFTLNGAPCS